MQTVLWNGNLYVCSDAVFHSYCSSSLSSSRGPYSRTYAICQSPPPDSRKMSSGETTLTLSSSNLNHSSDKRQWWREKEETSSLVYIWTCCMLNTLHCQTTVVTFFPLDPSHIVTWWAGAALVCQHSLQVIVATVVGTSVCRRGKHSVNLSLSLTQKPNLEGKILPL